MTVVLKKKDFVLLPKKPILKILSSPQKNGYYSPEARIVILNMRVLYTKIDRLLANPTRSLNYNERFTCIKEKYGFLCMQLSYCISKLDFLGYDASLAVTRYDKRNKLYVVEENRYLYGKKASA
jgi:hypothetical protein